MIMYRNKDYVKVLCVFLKGTPTLHEEVTRVDPGFNFLKCSLQLPAIKIVDKAFEKTAAELGVGTWELALSFSCKNNKEFRIKLKNEHKKISEMVELGWEEYCRLSGFVDD